MGPGVGRTCWASTWPEFDSQRSLTEKPGKVLCPCNLTLLETERYLEFSGGLAPLIEESQVQIADPG